MNSNLIYIFFGLLLVSSCGVKGPPVAPAGSAIPSYTDQFLDKEQEAAEELKKQEEEKLKKKALLEAQGTTEE